MIEDVIVFSSCLNCNANLRSLGKRRSAMYCGDVCKNSYRKIKNPEVHSQQTAKYKSSVKGRAIAMYHGAKLGSRRSKDNFEITPEWIFQKLEGGACEVTGLPFTYSLQARNPWSPSIDRIDPSKGYTLENTRVVVWIYNTAKNVFSDEDVLLMCQAVVNTASGAMK